MERTEQIEQLKAFIIDNEISLDNSPDILREFREALYCFNELHLFDSDVELSEKDVLIAYALVSSILEKPFPSNLCM